MVFLLNKTSLSALRLHSQRVSDSSMLSRRGFHVELGAREKALLAQDPSLQRFKSHKNTVRRLKKVGDVLTIMVVAGCCYEIYAKAVEQDQARKQETSA